MKTKFYPEYANSILLIFTILITLFPGNAFSQTYSFTNCGASGRLGPTQAQVNATYTGANPLTGMVTTPTQGIQQWTVPTSGQYRITVAGAGGGGSTTVGGRGKLIQADVTLNAGEVLRIIAGQKGSNGGCGSSGGGGGSFVVKLTGNLPVIIAGGGAGYLSNTGNVLSSSDAAFTNSGKNSICNTGTGGTGGNGGTGSTNGWGCGGGGFSTDGTEAANAAAWSYSGKGYAFMNGAMGGNTANNAAGGFGCGGGTHGCTGGGGGGGGYSGGGGSNQNINPNAGGGGGSFVSAAMSNVIDLGFNQNAGYVTITNLTIPATALNFDGVNDFVNVGTSLNPILDTTGALTVEAWVYPTSTNQLGVIVGNYWTSTASMQFLLRRDNSSYVFYVDLG
ncbi:MAG: hypothetical protein Q8M15_03805, partial [Bacteroidota bacterium]|nr:hypothetical protein [Bacteroidota bacterium]